MQSYPTLLARLSHQSVVKHFDAYADVAWDDPEHAIDPRDPRWTLRDDDTLGATEWYQALPADTRARLGLHLIVHKMKLGLDFENVLSRGLLEFASTRPNGAPEFRYALHEVIEESQHSLMFQEFVNRAGIPVRGLTGIDAFFARQVVGFGRTFPELFFLFVLGGESPIDREQRRALEHKHELHPLLVRVMQIHVTEEARHLCFASAFLRDRADRMGAFRKLQLRVRAPIIFKAMAGQMLQPPRAIVREYAIPRRVVREAYTASPSHRANVSDGLASVRKLCEEIGVIDAGWRTYWRALGLLPVGPARNSGGAPPAERSALISGL